MAKHIVVRLTPLEANAIETVVAGIFASTDWDEQLTYFGDGKSVLAADRALHKLRQAAMPPRVVTR